MRSALMLTCAAAVFGAARVSAGEWTGRYAGFNTGWGFGSDQARFSTVFSPTGYFAAGSVPAINNVGQNDVNPHGAVAGGQVGVLEQRGRWVYGIEADLNLYRMRDGHDTTVVYPCCGPTSFTIHQEVLTNWLVTLRPRFGVDVGGTLIYGTAGLALTRLNNKQLFTDTFAGANGGEEKVRDMFGFTWGIGAEHKLQRLWSVKLEYLFVDFERTTSTNPNLSAFNPAISFPTNPMTQSVGLKTSVVRLGFNRRF
jgi:outer membrane immunogenic protein